MKKYFLHEGTSQQGPFTLEELRAKKITPETSIWFHPMPEWKPAGEIEELKTIFNNDPVPAQPAAPLVTAAKEEDWRKKQFYFADGTGQQGPFKSEQLAGKNIHPDTPIWYEGLVEWTTAGKISGLMDIINNPPATPQPAPASAIIPQEENWSKKQYYFADGGAQQGPFKLEQLAGKNIHSDTLIWYEGLPEWTMAGKVAGLKDIVDKPQNVRETVGQNNTPKSTPMKVKFEIRREKEKPETFSDKEADIYILSAALTLSERERKIYDEHPLFKEMVFMEYNESYIDSDKQIQDSTKRILVSSIYESPVLTFTAHSVDGLVELRNRVIEASENLVKKVKVLESLGGPDEMEFKIPG